MLAPCIIWDSQAIVGGVPLQSGLVDLPLNRQRLTILANCSVAATLSLKAKFGSAVVTFQSVTLPAASPTPVEIYYAIGELYVEANSAVNGSISVEVKVTPASQG